MLSVTNLSRDISRTQMHLIRNEQRRTFWWNKEVWKPKKCERFFPCCWWMNERFQNNT